MIKHVWKKNKKQQKQDDQVGHPHEFKHILHVFKTFTATTVKSPKKPINAAGPRLAPLGLQPQPLWRPSLLLPWPPWGISKVEKIEIFRDTMFICLLICLLIDGFTYWLKNTSIIIIKDIVLLSKNARAQRQRLDSAIEPTGISEELLVFLVRKLLFC